MLFGETIEPLIHTHTYIWGKKHLHLNFVDTISLNLVIWTAVRVPLVTLAPEPQCWFPYEKSTYASTKKKLLIFIGSITAISTLPLWHPQKLFTQLAAVSKFVRSCIHYPTPPNGICYTVVPSGDCSRVHPHVNISPLLNVQYMVSLCRPCYAMEERSFDSQKLKHLCSFLAVHIMRYKKKVGNLR